MSLVVALLCSLGVVDLVRWSADETTVRRTVAAMAAGCAASGVLGWASGPDAAPVLVIAGVLAALVWAVAGMEELHWDGRTGLAVASVLALATLLLLPQAPRIGGPLARWYAAWDVPGLAGVTVERAALAFFGVLFLVTTGNRLVRGVLAAAGTSPVTGEASLRGGRWLGPLERAFILASALAGDLTAAAVVIAAKGVLRLPEIRAAHEADGSARPDTVAEYFLVGTFTSWLLALLVAGLVRLAA